jgi:hypothetical protein
MTKLNKIFILLFLILFKSLAYSENRSFLVFESSSSPIAVLWWNDNERFLEPVVAKDLGYIYMGVSAKPVSKSALSYIVMEKTSDVITPINVSNGKIVTLNQIEALRSKIKENNSQISNLENQIQQKKTKISELRKNISQKIPIEQILQLRSEKDEFDNKKTQVDAEAQVVEQSLKNLDLYRINPDEISAQERLLQQVNQELRIGVNAKKPIG